MLNHIDIGGRLTRDPELRYTQSQVAVCSFSVAVERDYAPQGQRKKPTSLSASYGGRALSLSANTSTRAI